MKNEVVVNGVKLTRQQVEAALKDLNTPETREFKAGDLVKIRGGVTKDIAVVVTNDIKARLCQSYYPEHSYSTLVWAVKLNSGAVYTWAPESLELVKAAG